VFQDVYRVVRLIPRGKVASYGQVARLSGHPRAARFVGFALHANPDPATIPCHRVVFKDGSICTGYAFGGPAVQRERLLAEGVAFADETHVNMAACQWELVDSEELAVVERLQQAEPGAEG
jgi:methylated-DNA-protein-cysteine methyltransferase-like protein